MSEKELQIIDDIRQKGFRPQVVGCFLNNNKILFLYKKKHSLWQLPQGGIDNKETVRQAIKREMQEELGEKFIKNCDFYNIEITEEAQLEFPKKTKGSRDLKTDTGKEMFMKGKRYLFIKIKVNSPELDIDQTEFDNHKWLNFKDAIILSNKIYQIGKRKITLKAIKSIGLNNASSQKDTPVSDDVRQKLY